jgi:hypothetical protein
MRIRIVVRTISSLSVLLAGAAAWLSACSSAPSPGEESSSVAQASNCTVDSPPDAQCWNPPKCGSEGKACCHGGTSYGWCLFEDDTCLGNTCTRCGVTGLPSCGGQCSQAVSAGGTCVACDAVSLSPPAAYVDPGTLGNVNVSLQVSPALDVAIPVTVTNTANPKDTTTLWAFGAQSTVSFTGLTPFATYDVVATLDKPGQYWDGCPLTTSTNVTLSYAPITATWSGHAWFWTPDGDGNTDFGVGKDYPPLSVTFAVVGNAWQMTVGTFSFPYISLQQGTKASGTVNGNDAMLQAPLHLSIPYKSHPWDSDVFDVTLSLSTEGVIMPEGTLAPTGVAHTPNGFLQMVGKGTTLDGTKTVYAQVQGTITAWP